MPCGDPPLYPNVITVHGSTGWVCPVCHRGVAPTATVCPCVTVTIAGQHPLARVEGWSSWMTGRPMFGQMGDQSVTSITSKTVAPDMEE